MFGQIVMGDFDRGIIKRKYLYLLIAAVTVLLCVIAHMKVQNLQKFGRVEGAVSVADMYMTFFRGSNIVNPDDGKNFYMSEQYLLMSLSAAFMISSYAARDLYGYGQQIIIRSKSTIKWWLGKIVWCFVSNAAMYLIIFLTMSLISALNGYSFSMKLNGTLLAALGYMSSQFEISAGNMTLLLFVMPFMSTFALCMLQMLLSIVFSPIIALVAVMAEMTACVYSNMGIFLSNGLMLIRNNIFYVNGTNNADMLAVEFLTVVLAAIIGSIYISHMDMLRQKEI